MEKKILIINTIGFRYEGISNVIRTYLHALNTDGLQIDLTIYENTPDELISELGTIVKCVKFPLRKVEPLKFYARLIRTLSINRYDVIHIHGNSSTMYLDAFIAKILGVKNIITHSHSTKTDHKILNELFRALFGWCVTIRVACSKLSGDWVYKTKNYIVINNAIDLRKFSYNRLLRETLRNKYNIANCVVLGHVGNFYEPKNHSFLIDVFYEYHLLCKESRLILAGDGAKIQDIKEKVKRLNIEDSVCFLGRVNNTEEVYQMLDVFVFPSLWEGLPVSLIEAQANGLPCIVSDKVTTEAKLLENTLYSNIDIGAQEWAEIIYKNDISRQNQETINLNMVKFDIFREANELKKLYLS